MSKSKIKILSVSDVPRPEVKSGRIPKKAPITSVYAVSEPKYYVPPPPPRRGIGKPVVIPNPVVIPHVPKPPPPPQPQLSAKDVAAILIVPEYTLPIQVPVSAARLANKTNNQAMQYYLDFVSASVESKNDAKLSTRWANQLIATKTAGITQQIAVLRVLSSRPNPYATKLFGSPEYGPILILGTGGSKNQLTDVHIQDLSV